MGFYADFYSEMGWGMGLPREYRSTGEWYSPPSSDEDEQPSEEEQQEEKSPKRTWEMSPDMIKRLAKGMDENEVASVLKTVVRGATHFKVGAGGSGSMKVEQGEWKLEFKVARDCDPKEPGATPWNSDKINFRLGRSYYDSTFDYDLHFINKNGEVKSGAGLSNYEAYLEKIDGEMTSYANTEYTVVVNVYPYDE